MSVESIVVSSSGECPPVQSAADLKCTLALTASSEVNLGVVTLSAEAPSGGPGRLRIAIMGLTASGKTYQAKAIASSFGLDYVSGSQLLLYRLGGSEGVERHIWFGDKGDALERKRDKSTVDAEVDRELVTIARGREHVVLDSWTVPWLYNDSDLTKIYLRPSLRARAEMSLKSKADERFKTPEDLEPFIARKDEVTRTRFLRMYGFDILDTTSFHLVIDNGPLQPEQTSDLLRRYVADMPAK